MSKTRKLDLLPTQLQLRSVRSLNLQQNTECRVCEAGFVHSRDYTKCDEATKIDHCLSYDSVPSCYKSEVNIYPYAGECIEATIAVCEQKGKKSICSKYQQGMVITTSRINVILLLIQLTVVCITIHYRVGV